MRDQLSLHEQPIPHPYLPVSADQSDQAIHGCFAKGEPEAKHDCGKEQHN
jgi:hypothetical protein